MVDKTMFTEETAALLGTLFRISASILRSEADAQDAVQQGLMKAWEARGRAKPEHFRPWVTRIVINECGNIQRHRMRVMLVEDMPVHTDFNHVVDHLSSTVSSLADDPARVSLYHSQKMA